MKLTDFSIGIPSLKKDHIYRGDFTSFLKKKLDENKIVFLEGDSDSGKTTLCAEFCHENFENTISVFFNPLNSLDYNIDYFLENIISQLKVFIDPHFDDFTYNKNTGLEELQRLLFKVRKQKHRQNLYFLIDGLEKSRKDNYTILKSLVELLPLGDDNIRLLLTFKQKDFLRKNENYNKLDTDTVSIVGFSDSQIKSFFQNEDINLNDEEILSLAKLTERYPGKLQIYKKLCKTTSLSEIIDKEFKKAIELQCRAIDLEDNILNVILSIISLKDNFYSYTELAEIVQISTEAFTGLIDGITILEIKDGNVIFQSKNYKSYFKNKLRHNAKKVDDLLINYLSNSNTIQSKIQLSEIYAENKKWGELLTIIDESFLANTINTTESLISVNNSIQLAHKASLESNDVTNLFKYSFQGSIINDFNNTQNLESEIQARLAIDDFTGAINLAESTLLRINRLKLLSLIARKQKEEIKHVDETLINTIKNLYNTVDFTDAGDKIYDIVANLMYVMPYLALEIIENSSSENDENDINEWIIAKLSVASIKSENTSSNEEKESNDKLIEKIENNNSKKISKAVSFLVGNYNATKVLEELKKISDSKERIKLLRIWLSNNKYGAKNVEIVIEKALDELVISSSDSILSLEILKDITYQLPYIKNITIRQRLYSRFVQLDQEIKEIGLDKDRIVYELNLFHCLFTMYKDKSIVKLGSILNSASKITDLLIKIEVYSEIYSKIIKINKGIFKRQQYSIKDTIRKLNENILENSANHHSISRQYIKTLAYVDVDFSLELVKSFNTQSNREKGRINALNSYLDNNLRYIKIEKLDELLNQIETDYHKNYFYINILDRFCDSKGLHVSFIKYCFKFISQIDRSTISFANKIFCFVQLYKIVAKNPQLQYEKNRFIKKQIEEYWEKIDQYWDKVDIGFLVCSELSKIDRSFSMKIFKSSEKLKNESWISSQETSETYVYSTSIVIRSFVGLVKAGLNSNTHYKNLETLIDRIPSQNERLELWTEVNFSLFLENKLELAQQIYNSHVLPLLQGIIINRESFSSCVRALVLTHNYNSELAVDYINELDDLTKDNVYASICEFYITRKNPYEIYEGDILNSNCNYNDILKSLPILEKIQKDIFIYDTISSIQKVISNRNSNLQNTQKRDIANKLSLLINEKLPDKLNIKHSGYKIISDIKIALITKENGIWKNLYDEARQINNLSDRILVKANLLEHLPFDRVKIVNKIDLFDEIISDLKLLNNNYEYIERIDAISEIMFETHKIKWKEMVFEAFAITKNITKDNISYRYQKALIDTMFRLDNDFAKELLNSIENKDSKKNLYLRDYYMGLEVAKKIKNNQTIEQKQNENSRTILRGVVNSLAAFNSGKLSIRKPDDMNKYLNFTHKLPLKDCLALYHYYFANCNKHTPPKNAENKHHNLLLRLFDDIIKSTNLIEILATNTKRTSVNVNLNEFSSNFALRPGNREEAIKFIQQWINDEVDEFLVFADPYFEAKDIEFAKLLKQAGKDNILLDILAHEYVEQQDIEKEWKRISEESIPYVNITFCNVQNENKCPFHDRWLITKNGGLRIGTSFNSIGISRESEISIISPLDADNIYQTILKGYIDRTKREFNLQKILYKSYNL